MITLLTVIGARPQIIKSAALSRAIKNVFSSNLTEIVVHTGQHYDANMSEVFINELGIPVPKYNLNVGSGNHGFQTAKMLEGLEKIMLEEKPDFVVLYGDTNSTLAGSIAAVKLNIPVVHIEAGLRSFNKKMPEEINRIVCDHSSTLLFTPTPAGFRNLKNEGFDTSTKAPFSINKPGVFHCGDVMFDNALYYAKVAREFEAEYLNSLDITENNFLLTTIHRDLNTDNELRFKEIFKALLKLIDEDNIDIVLPIHPRTSKMMTEKSNAEIYTQIKSCPKLKIIEPVSYLDMIVLEKNCRMVLTDSGGVQKEAYFYRKPGLVLRTETEWTEIVESGAARLCDANFNKITEGYHFFKNNAPVNFPELFGDGKSAEFICRTIINAKN